MSVRRSAAALMRRDDGAILMALRLPSRNLGELWELPGGKVEEGEDPRQALQRELLEELELRAEIGDELCVTSFESRGRVFELYAFAADPKNEPGRLTEHSAWRWVAADEWRGLAIVDSDRAVLEKLLP